jgi:hypothetical protein
MKKAILCVSPFLVVLISLACFGQATGSGDIRGSVTDPSGALIPGVTVTVTNVDTGVAKDFTTNQDGLYDTSSIVNGSYKLTFIKDGFEKLVRGPVSLQVGTTTVNAQLQVGSAAQEVTVTADVTLLKTESSEQSTTLEAKSMEQLPQIAAASGVSWENFMILLPGATGCGGGRTATRERQIPAREWRSMATCPTATSLRMEPPPRSRIVRMRIPQYSRPSPNSRSTVRHFRRNTVSAGLSSTRSPKVAPTSFTDRSTTTSRTML